MFTARINRIALRASDLIVHRRGDDYAQVAVILVVIVLGGLAAFTALGGKISDLIKTVTAGI